MHEGTEDVDGHVQAVTHQHHENEQDKARDRWPAQGSQEVEHLRHNARRQTQRQNSAVGQQVGGVADEVVGTVFLFTY